MREPREVLKWIRRSRLRGLFALLFGLALATVVVSRVQTERLKSLRRLESHEAPERTKATARDQQDGLDVELSAAGSRHKAKSKKLVAEYEGLCGKSTKDWKDNKRAAEILCQLAESDPDSLFPLLANGIRVGRDHFSDPEFALLARVAKGNLGRLIEWYEGGLDDRTLKQAALSALGTRLDSPDAARIVKEFIENLGDSSDMRIARAIIHMPSSDSEVGLTLSLIDSLKIGDSNKEILLNDFARLVAGTRPELALELAARSKQFDPRTYSDMMLKVLEAKPSLVEDAISGMDTARLNSLVGNSVFISSLSNSGNIALAEQLARSIPLTKDNESGFMDLVRVVALNDGKRAMDLVRGMEDGVSRGKAYALLYESANKADREVVLGEILALPGGQKRVCLQSLVRSIAETDNREAMAFVGMAPVPEQQSLYREIARVSAYRKTGEAVKILEDPMLSEKIGADFRQEMLNATVATWAKQDLSAAQQWVEKLPEADAAKGYQGLMTSWMKTDPVAASEWLSKQPLGPAREAGAKVLIEQIKDTDPERAEQWRKSLTAPAGK